MPPIQAPAAYTKISFQVVARWQKTIPTPITIKFDRFIVRQVTDSRTVWAVP